MLAKNRPLYAMRPIPSHYHAPFTRYDDAKYSPTQRLLEWPNILPLPLQLLWYNCNSADNIDLIYIELYGLDLKNQNEHHVAFRIVKIKYRTLQNRPQVTTAQNEKVKST